MGLKEKLLENKKLNQECQFEVAEIQSQLSYQLGNEEPTTPSIDFESLYDPFVKTYADIKLALENGTEENPVAARRFVEDIVKSTETIKTSLENIESNTELWMAAVIKAGLMGGVDLMGTPYSRYKSMSILDENLEGILHIVAENGNINRLAWEIYTKEGVFIEKMFLNKLNTLSETQDMFVSIPDTSKQNQDFKKSNPEIFEVKALGGDQEETVLTGGITENFRKMKSDGSPDLYEKPLGGGLVQQFQKIDKETIKTSLPFQLGMDKITAELLTMYEGDDQVIAFNNNIISEVTDHYIKPGKALRENEKNRFVEDYKDWFLEKEIGDEMPIGSPKKKEEIVDEEVAEEQLPDGQEVQVEEQVVS